MYNSFSSNKNLWIRKRKGTIEWEQERTYYISGLNCWFETIRKIVYFFFNFIFLKRDMGNPGNWQLPGGLPISTLSFFSAPPSTIVWCQKLYQTWFLVRISRKSTCYYYRLILKTKELGPRFSNFQQLYTIWKLCFIF